MDHTASPRSICRDTRHSYRYSKSKYRGRNHVIQQKCAKTKCVRVNLPPHSTPLTTELYLRPAPDARQKPAISPFFSRCHDPVPTAGSLIRALCDTQISPKAWLSRRLFLPKGTPEGPGSRSRQSVTTLISDTNGSAHRPTDSSDAVLPVTPAAGIGPEGNAPSDASERAGRQARRQSLPKPACRGLDYTQMCTCYNQNQDTLRERSARHDDTDTGAGSS